ncbi:FMN-binding glutamate synthase family protein [Collibacillus ludicampi]|uniref:FMN-binding glutamate synthase family protein n=1 Tax=Collibacillus ludicampi TaxID=2771369 RepID=A0AAV4LC98_9BACL|nr:FMN-binding glutamate synthase family protein [Collibacillus ludicampi]GIM45324.1 FMN-binding glutamate synthase family protein [Collibacillus ludicampi]
MTTWKVIVIQVFAVFLGLSVFLFMMYMVRRVVLASMVKGVVKRFMSDRYAENVWELVSALTRMSPQWVLENALRAHTGSVIQRPLGSPRKFLNFDGLIFSPAQVAKLPTPEDTPVETTTMIGPASKKPLVLDIPLIVSAMGYGVGVSEQARLAFALGTSMVGTASNVGKGGFLPEERNLAKHLILQYHTGKWSKDPSILKQADMIEIRFGQGAIAGAAERIQPELLQGRARRIMNLRPGEDAVLHSRHEEVQDPEDLRKLVEKLRTLTEGIPIGVKFAAGNWMERDLQIALEASVDVIAIDGGQGGSHESPPIFQDDFGLPTIYALSRAVHFLEQSGKREQISLIVSGGLFTPDHFLKALALGADAVYLGTSVLYAMAHTQVFKAVPWEPPTQMVFYTGKHKEKLDPALASLHLANYLHSCMEEMKISVRALGKRSIKEVSKKDLAALDDFTAKVTGVRPVYHH